MSQQQKRNFIYSGHGIAFDRAGSLNFGIELDKNVEFFGAVNS